MLPDQRGGELEPGRRNARYVFSCPGASIVVREEVWKNTKRELTITGRVDMQARTYDPATGRFTSVDPMAGTPGDVLAANPYPYAANDPLDQSDPTGLHPINGADFNFSLWNAWSYWGYGYWGGYSPWYGYWGPSYGYSYSLRYVGARHYAAVPGGSAPKGLLRPSEAMVRAAIAACITWRVRSPWAVAT